MTEIAKNKYSNMKNGVYMGSNIPIDNQESKELEQKGGYLSDKIEALNKVNKKLRRYLIRASNLAPDSTEPTGWMMNYLINRRGAELVERNLGRDIAPYFPQMLEIIYEQAKQLTTTQQALDSAVEALEDARKAIIEEICVEYCGEIIKNYKLVQKSGEYGRYVHEKDIKFYEKLQRELYKQEWTNKAALASIKE